ncbi:hypothetical protein GOV12_08240 [Candidatus Pacearchaeota archaeon]|nr:hypothetical protein [Candidatus Pacearchaeota archaeon]
MKFSKKSQAWSMDIIIAVMIFSAGMLVFLIYTLNGSVDSSNRLESLSTEGDLIMNNILGEGSPDDWNIGNVKKIGIMSNDKINQTKFEKFYNLSVSDYSKTRSLFNTKYHYLFYFDNMTIFGNPVSGIGKPGATINNIKNNSIDLIRITRFTSYKEKPLTVYLYVWNEE